jgi:hypothetical protein
MSRAISILTFGCVVASCKEPGGVEPDVFDEVTSSSGTTMSPSTSTTASPETSADGTTTEVAGTSTSSPESSSSSADESSTGEPTTCGNGAVDPGEVCFVPQEVLLEAGLGAWDVAVGDYDLDGNLDIATLEADADTISVRYGDGARGFAEPDTYPATAQGFRLRAADLDDDDDLDIVAVGVDVTVLNNHDGVLEAATLGGFGLFPDQLNDAVLGEIDVDAGLDLVHTTTLSMYTQGGIANGDNWEFETGVPIFGVDIEEASGIALAAWEFDEDEIDDILFLNRESEYAQILMSNGTGGLQLFGEAWVCPTGTGAYNAIVGDLDDDGHQDLVVSCSTDDFAVVRGVGDGTFLTQEYYEVEGALRLALADADADGDIDVLVSAAAAGQLQVWTNDGTGVLDRAAALGVGALVRPVDSGDLDGDGAIDLVTAFTDKSGDFTAVFWSDP